MAKEDKDVQPRIIQKTQLAKWLADISKDRQLIAPVKTEQQIKYTQVKELSQVELGFNGPGSNLREWFTPHSEQLFTFNKGIDGKLTLNATQVKSPARIILGVRACDAAALKYMDTVYGFVPPKDGPYFARRENTVLVGLFCHQPEWSCFCGLVGDGPEAVTGLDLRLADLGESYLAEAFTTAGEALLASGDYAEATEAQLAQLQQMITKSREGMDESIRRNPNWRKEWDEKLFSEFAERCLGCGICSFNCPTCHCFDMVDEVKGNHGSRHRAWDTCQFEKFTLMGQGHNPRPSRTSRTRQRVFHKFDYSIERYQMLGCVGCGRCVSLCPVNIDMREILKQIQENVI